MSELETATVPVVAEARLEVRSRPEVGDVVVFRNSQGLDLKALVTMVHGQDKTAAINLAFVSRDEKDHDGYGRAIRRATSIVHASQRSITGICWRHAGEEMPEMPASEPTTRRR